MNEPFDTLDTGAATETAEKKEQKPKRKLHGRKKAYRSVPKGRAYIQSTYNNTMLTFTDDQGGVLAWS